MNQYVILSIVYLVIAMLVFYLFKPTKNGCNRGMIVFTAPQSFVLGLLWAPALIAFVFICIKVRLPERPHHEYPYELVDLGDRSEDLELEIRFGHDVADVCKAHVTPCTYRDWTRSWFPIRIRKGWRLVFEFELHDKNKKTPFTGRIVPVQNRDDMFIYVNQLAQKLLTSRR